MPAVLGQLVFARVHSYISSLPIEGSACPSCVNGCLLVLAASGRISTEGSLEVDTVTATRLCPADWLQARTWPFIHTAGAVAVQQRGVC